MPQGNSVRLSMTENGRRVIWIYGGHKDILKGLPSRIVQRFKGRSPCKGFSTSDNVKERAHLILFTYIEKLVIPKKKSVSAINFVFNFSLQHKKARKINIYRMCQCFGSFQWGNNYGATAYFEDYYKKHIEILQQLQLQQSNGGILTHSLP